MRISTSQIYTQATKSMMEGQSSLADIQAKLSSGKSFTSLAEDPVAANQVVTLKRELAQLDMFQTNIDSTRRRLELEETTLSNLNIALDRARELSIQAANNTLTDSDRLAISYELEQIVGFSVNLMNTQDAKGEYLFSGTKGKTLSYAEIDGRYVYQGDSGSREIQIDSSAYVQSGDSGRDIFESISGLSDVAVTGELAGAIQSSTVTDADAYRALTARTGDIQLSVARNNDDGLTYSLRDSAGNPLFNLQGEELSFVPYDDTQTLPNTITVELDGIEIELALPASADFKDEPLIVGTDAASTAILTDFTVSNAPDLVSFFNDETSIQLVITAQQPAAVGPPATLAQYTYELQDAVGNLLQDTDGIDLTGDITASGNLNVDFGSASINFEMPTPADVAIAVPMNGTLATFELQPAETEPGLRVLSADKLLLEDFQILDATDFTQFMQANGDLSLSIDFDDVSEYSWSLTNSEGVEQISGVYAEPSFGLISSGTPLDFSSSVNLANDSSFMIEIDGERYEVDLAANTYTESTTLVNDLQTAINLDSSLLSAGITASYDSVTGLTFTATDPNVELQFASVDNVIQTALGIANTSNRIGISLDGIELDLNLPLDQVDSTSTLRFEPPQTATLSYAQPKTNIVNALLDTIDVLRTPAQGDPDKMLALNTQMAGILTQMTEAQERIGETMASIGARINGVDNAEFSNIDFKLLTESTLSAVEDLDYASASTELAKRQLVLEAAFASFAKIQGLSLFNYLN